MNIRILLLLFTAMLAVSTSPIIARYLVNVPAVSISFWRMGFGAMILWGFSLIKKQNPLEPENRKRTIIAGIFLGIHFVLFFAAIKLTSIANATFLGTLAPLFTLCLEKFWLKRNIQKNMIFALAIVGKGIYILINFISFINESQNEYAWVIKGIKFKNIILFFKNSFIQGFGLIFSLTLFYYLLKKSSNSFAGCALERLTIFL